MVWDDPVLRGQYHSLSLGPGVHECREGAEQKWVCTNLFLSALVCDCDVTRRFNSSCPDFSIMAACNLGV